MIVLSTINLILTIIAIVGILIVIRRLMAQEDQLKEVQSLLVDVVAPGVTEIIRRLDSLPTDNPAIQDEIDGIKGAARAMADQINAKLNPPAPPEPEV